MTEQVDDALFAISTELGSPAASLGADSYTDESAAALRTAGLRVVAWTVNDPEEAKRLRDLGAHALCTDVPDHIMRSLQGAATSG